MSAATEEVRQLVRDRISRETPAAGRLPEEIIEAAFDLLYERILIAARGATGGSAGLTAAGLTAVELIAIERWCVQLRGGPVTMPTLCGALCTESIDHVRRIGERIGGDPDAVLDIVSAVSGVLGSVQLASSARGRGGGELEEVDLDANLRVILARALLLGGTAAVDLYSQLTVFGIDPSRDYVAFRARPRPGHDRNELARELEAALAAESNKGVVAHLDGDLVGFLATPPSQVLTGVVGIGPATIPDRLDESFQLATRALAVAGAWGLSGVHRFDELGLLPAILADVDMGEALRRRYLQPVAAVEPWPEILTAVRMYFSCGMHVDRAAGQMSVHPNTLRNRIRRFEELAEAELRDTRVAMEVWWALQSVALTDPATGPGETPPSCREIPLPGATGRPPPRDMTPARSRPAQPAR